MIYLEAWLIDLNPDLNQAIKKKLCHFRAWHDVYDTFN